MRERTLLIHSVLFARGAAADVLATRRAVNADLFRAADLSLSIESLPLNQSLLSLPVASASRFSAVDAAFNSKLVGLHTALPLGDVVRKLMQMKHRYACAVVEPPVCHCLGSKQRRNYCTSDEMVSTNSTEHDRLFSLLANVTTTSPLILVVTRACPQDAEAVP